MMTKSPLLLSILAVLPACGEEEETRRACMSVDAAVTECPAGERVDPGELSTPDSCEYAVIEAHGEGTRTQTWTQAGDQVPACCYSATVVKDSPGCVVGRPYYDDCVALLARAVDSEGNDLAAKDARAVAWANAGLGEHASVAAFGRLSLQLMRLGAPLELLREVQRAALEEVGHAELCFEFAERHGAAGARAGIFPLPPVVDVSGSLADVAHAAVREGCLSETLGAHVAAVAAELASEPNVRAVLSRIAEEESTHAVLSFRIVAWALQSGGKEVRDAVRAAFDEPWPSLDLDELALRANVDVVELRAAAAQGVEQVLLPAAVALLA